MNTLFFSLIEHQPAETALPNVSTIGTKLVGGWVSSADNWQQTSDLVMLAQKPCSCQTRYHLAYAMNTLSLFQAGFFCKEFPNLAGWRAKTTHITSVPKWRTFHHPIFPSCRGRTWCRRVRRRVRRCAVSVAHRGAPAASHRARGRRGGGAPGHAGQAAAGTAGGSRLGRKVGEGGYNKVEWQSGELVGRCWKCF